MRTSSRRFASAMHPARADGRAVRDAAVPDDDARARHAAAGRERVTADLVLSPTAPASRRPPPTQARRIAGVDAAVAAATTTLGPSLGSRYQTIPRRGRRSAGAGRVLDLDVRDGSLAGLRDGTVALSATRAKAAHAEVGDRVDVLWRRRAPRRRVVAITRGARLRRRRPADRDGRGHRTSPLSDAVLISTAPGAAARGRRGCGRCRALPGADRRPQRRPRRRRRPDRGDDQLAPACSSRSCSRSPRSPSSTR